MFTYDFGYSWFVGYGLLIPLAIAAAIAAVAVARRWSRWIPAVAMVVAAFILGMAVVIAAAIL